MPIGDGPMRRAPRSLALGLAAVALASGVAIASTTTGTASQIRALVAASTKIQKLTPALITELSQISTLETRLAYPGVGMECLTACAFGDLSSKRTIVLYGDSHAMMWLPAVLAAEPKYRVDLFWDPTCPLVAIPGLAFADGTPPSNCAAFRASSVAAIRSIDPKLVLLGERTYQVVTMPGSKPISNATWAKALKTTIRQVKTRTTGVAVVQDIVAFNWNVLLCVAAYPSAIQKRCSSANPNSKAPGHQAAEKTAAVATGAKFVVTIPWFCTSTRCSPVVGSNFVHYDQGHVSVPYARYLAGVFGAAIAPLLR